jgi:membrane protease YdiL (CAAX protease family)
MTTDALAERAIHKDSSRAEKAEQADQYTLWQILGIWLAATLPMPILGFVVAPLLHGLIDLPLGFIFILMMLVGLTWQFVVTLVVLRWEMGTLTWEAVRRRLWIQNPRNPKTGERDPKLWWMIIPALAVGIGASLLVMAWTQLIPTVLPILTPVAFADTSNLMTPEFAPRLLGQWWILGVMLFLSLFNFFLGEEFIFRGLLLPKMNGAFGKWDWVVNGTLFAVYHVHLYWQIPALIVLGIAISGFTKRYRSIWFGTIMHGFMPIFSYLFLAAVIGGWMTL